MNDRSSNTQSDKISAEIAALASLDLKHLKLRWCDLYDTEPPPRISRELLMRAIAHRLQEREFGGLDPTTRRLLKRVADNLPGHAKRSGQARKAAPGTLLVRECTGRPIRLPCSPTE